MDSLASKSPDELAQELIRAVQHANVITRALRIYGVTVIVGVDGLEYSVSVLGLSHPARPRLVSDEPRRTELSS